MLAAILRRGGFVSLCERKAPLAVVAVAVAVALAGCGGSGGSSTGGYDSGAEAGSGGYVDWPLFGRIPERTHYLPAKQRALDPPLKEAWSIDTHGLIEFPPAIHAGVAYVINKFGNGKAVRLSDHKVLWELNIRPTNHGKPNFVTAPVYYRGRIYGAFLDGHVAAGDAATGKKDWVRKLHAHLESSPLAVDGTLYLGTDTTNVVALWANSGKTRWQFNSPAAIKASPSFHDGRLFVADYQSSVFSLDAKTGPVYGSPAVANVPGTPPTVYIGAENGKLFALDARTGKPRWHYDVGGPIPGTAVVIGHTVYTSSFETQETTGLDVRTHRRTFHIKQAGYTPMVSDGKRLYLVGYFSLIGLDPTRR